MCTSFVPCVLLLLARVCGKFPSKSVLFGSDLHVSYRGITSPSNTVHSLIISIIFNLTGVQSRFGRPCRAQNGWSTKVEFYPLLLPRILVSCLPVQPFIGHHWHIQRLDAQWCPDWQLTWLWDLKINVLQSIWACLHGSSRLVISQICILKEIDL